MLGINDELIEWFWSFGIKREGVYAIEAKWLDEAYECRRLLSIAENIGAGKALAAVWGPSQSGKSTLISSLIDDLDGSDSAVNWTPGQPTCFGGVGSNPDFLKLNPHNLGSDASGCVTRFVLRSRNEIADPEHPVRIDLGSPQQLMHALAAGFVSEANTALPDGTHPSFNESSIIKMLGEVGRVRTIERPLFEDLHAFTDVVQQLIATGNPRYRDLAANDRWAKATRKSVLGSPRLLGNRRALEQFIHDLLWNGSAALTELYEKLCNVSMRFARFQANGGIFCSLETAALLLDIESASHLKRGREATGNAELKRIARLAADLTWTEANGRVIIGRGLRQQLLDSPADFGLFQGAVWQLEVPLRQDFLGRRALASHSSKQFLSFLQRADLLDFPGVALEDEKEKTQLIDVNSPDVDQQTLLKSLLKRGKTNSIVSSYARSLAVDEFLILVRSGKFPAKPGQLVTSIEQWWAAADPSFQSTARDTTRTAPLPVKIGMTFFAPILEACKAGIGIGLGPVFEMLDRLGPLANTQLVTLLALSYPWFKEGRIDLSDEVVRQVVKEILDDADFKNRFANDISLNSFKAMVENARSQDQDGGVGYLFEQLAMLSSAPKMRHLERLSKYARDRLRVLMLDCLPTAGDGPGPEVHLRAFAQAVKDYIASAPAYEEFNRCIDCGRFIREISTFSKEVVGTLPLNMTENSRAKDLRDYIGLRFEAWKSEKSQLSPPAPEIDVKVRPFINALGELTLIECGDDLARWIRVELPHIRTVEGARYVREYISIAFSNAMLKGTRLMTRDPTPASTASNYEKQLLEFMRQGARGERPSSSYDINLLNLMRLQSPEYRMVIAPFLDHLERLAQLATAAPDRRPPQPGDEKLRTIYQLLPA
jgi:hypothetical protein